MWMLGLMVLVLVFLFLESCVMRSRPVVHQEELHVTSTRDEREAQWDCVQEYPRSDSFHAWWKRATPEERLHVMHPSKY